MYYNKNWFGPQIINFSYIYIFLEECWNLNIKHFLWKTDFPTIFGPFGGLAIIWHISPTSNYHHS